MMISGTDHYADFIGFKAKKKPPFGGFSYETISVNNRSGRWRNQRRCRNRREHRVVLRMDRKFHCLRYIRPRQEAVEPRSQELHSAEWRSQKG